MRFMFFALNFLAVGGRGQSGEGVGVSSDGTWWDAAAFGGGYAFSKG